MERAILLFAHGARDPDWALPFQAIRERVAAGSGGAPVALAFLEFMQPSLADAVGALSAAGARHVTVVPLFMAQGGHLKRDVPLLLDELRARHAGVAVDLAPAIGDVPELIAAIADWVCRTALPTAAIGALQAPGTRPGDGVKPAPS